MIALVVGKCLTCIKFSYKTKEQLKTAFYFIELDDKARLYVYLYNNAVIVKIEIWENVK